VRRPPRRTSAGVAVNPAMHEPNQYGDNQMTNDQRPLSDARQPMADAVPGDQLPDEHDARAAQEAERKLRAGGSGIGDPDSPASDDGHDPAAVADAERKMRGGVSGD
jgi:hypothetical protein